MTRNVRHIAAQDLNEVRIGLPDLRDGQRWFLPSNARKPARTVVEISEATGYVDFADANGERRLCLESSFRSWAMRYGARLG